jgi:hypothetical protein
MCQPAVDLSAFVYTPNDEVMLADKARVDTVELADPRLAGHAFVQFLAVTGRWADV